MECGELITETGDLLITTESGDQIVTECFGLSRPGRTFRTTAYPYWSPKKKTTQEEDEELMILAAIEDD